MLQMQYKFFFHSRANLWIRLGPISTTYIDSPSLDMATSCGLPNPCWQSIIIIQWQMTHDWMNVRWKESSERPSPDCPGQMFCLQTSQRKWIRKQHKFVGLLAKKKTPNRNSCVPKLQTRRPYFRTFTGHGENTANIFPFPTGRAVWSTEFGLVVQSGVDANHTGVVTIGNTQGVRLFDQR